MKVLVTQSRLTLCDPMNYSLPGSSVHEILQAKLLERLFCYATRSVILRTSKNQKILFFQSHQFKIHNANAMNYKY